MLDPIYPSESYVNFIPYGLIQTTDSTIVKNQITQQNRFLTQNGIAPILNIAKEKTTSGLEERLLALPSVTGPEPTYLNANSAE